jgi:hypothetical protein
VKRREKNKLVILPWVVAYNWKWKEEEK